MRSAFNASKLDPNTLHEDAEEILILFSLVLCLFLQCNSIHVIHRTICIVDFFPETQHNARGIFYTKNKIWFRLLFLKETQSREREKNREMEINT